MAIFKKLIEFRELQSNPQEFLTSKRLSPRGRYAIGAAGLKFHLCFHPDAAQRVLIQKQQVYGRCDLVFDRIRALTGSKGLVQLQGKDWAVLRQSYAKMFDSRSLKTLTPGFTAKAEKMLSSLADQSSVDVLDLVSNFVLSNALELFAGHDDQRARLLSRQFIKLNRICGKRMLKPLALPSLTAFLAERRLNRSVRSYLKDSPLQNEIAQAGSSLLHDQIKTFLFAGHETTTSSIVSTIHLLASHPDYQLQYRKASKSERVRLLELFYLEALRLYPPAWILVRTAKSDDMDFGVARGDHIMIAVREIHRHSDFWEKADQFLPERHLKKSTHPGQFIPYGAGAKKCIGAALAPIEATSLIGAILNRYHLHAPTTLDMEAHITLFPKGPVPIQWELLQ